MTYGILLEKAATPELPQGYCYAHIPGLGLTTHGEGIEGARAAAEDLLTLWLTEKRAAGDLPRTWKKSRRIFVNSISDL